MVNATQMAKPFGKRPAKWLELPSTKEFLKTLSTIRKSDSEFVVTINGGTTEKGKGTWMHEDVALEFARWLSPTFAIWCNDRIKEILVGKSAKEDYSWVNPADYTRQDLADLILESEEDLQAQDKIIAEQKDKIKELEEKLERTRQEKIDARFERIENVVAKMAGMMTQGIRTAPVLPETAQTAIPEPQAEDDDEEADIPRPMLVHEMRMRIKEEHGVVIPYRRMFSLLAKMGWAVRNERYINRPGAVAVRKGYVLESDSKGVKDGAQFFTLRVTEKGYRKFVDEVIGKGGLL